MKISIEEYNKIMDKIFKQDKPVEEILIEALEEAGKYELDKLDK